MSLLGSKLFCLDHEGLKQFAWLLAVFILPASEVSKAILALKEAELYQMECEADGFSMKFTSWLNENSTANCAVSSNVPAFWSLMNVRTPLNAPLKFLY